MERLDQVVVAALAQEELIAVPPVRFVAMLRISATIFVMMELRKQNPPKAIGIADKTGTCLERWGSYFSPSIPCNTGDRSAEAVKPVCLSSKAPDGQCCTSNSAGHEEAYCVDTNLDPNNPNSTYTTGTSCS